ncbi:MULTISPECIES: hypothetical protein [unclassified Burkholderia]|uniref:hypothetical protein n=1 Tax=unclassified Burkholderia TaxID=2613784 RepID=UPI00117FF899|nr:MULTISPECIES: hypothetical protein [unclassified Burkholderia]NIE58872.1 hypothetical protein [Burkholderia sp. Ap-955]NIF11308.1 hypothetical protein [Burkholderia sp. Ax-1735]NIG03708.1 hypothetical protein [Burkholderia sp. Tr-849]
MGGLKQLDDLVRQAKQLEVALNSRARQAADELFSDYVKLFRAHMEASGFTVQASQVNAIAQYGSTNIMMACDFAEEQRTSSIVVRIESPALDDEYSVNVSRIPV